MFTLFQIFGHLAFNKKQISAHNINPVICFLIKAKWPKIWNRLNIVF